MAWILPVAALAANIIGDQAKKKEQRKQAQFDIGMNEAASLGAPGVGAQKIAGDTLYGQANSPVQYAAGALGLLGKVSGGSSDGGGAPGEDAPQSSIDSAGASAASTPLTLGDNPGKPDWSSLDTNSLFDDPNNLDPNKKRGVSFA